MKAYLAYLAIVLAFCCVNGNVIPQVVETNPEEEAGLFEGDIAGVENNLKGVAQIPTSSRIKWTNGIVPYVIDPEYSESNLKLIRSGLDMIEEATKVNGKFCIRFVPRTTEATYIRVFNDTGCYSYVGMQNKLGAQKLSLKSPGCMVKGIVAHEFMHALGFWHEQSRPDRDNFIQVLWDNIKTENAHNFNKYETDKADTQDLPYDYGSIMHYRDNSFSSNGQKTILVKQDGAQIGQRDALSSIDIEEIQTFYGCI